MNNELRTPLLSICIPTWNRGSFLKESLTKIGRQINNLGSEYIELIVSDNASTDKTSQVVKDFIAQGMPIKYNRNRENVGAGRNFLLCINKAKGKYIWLLGDDDFLKENALKQLIEILKGKDYGLLHLYTQGSKIEEATFISDRNIFLCKVSYWITFMSGNIFNRDIIEEVTQPEKYIPSDLLQVPYYLEAALCHSENVIIGINNILYPAADSTNNGGYNFFKVFVKYHLDIWHEKLTKYNIDMKVYDYIRKDLFIKHVVQFMVLLLLRRKRVSSKASKYERNRFKIDGAWQILFHYYGDTFYFYYYPIVFLLKKVCKLIKCH